MRQLWQLTLLASLFLFSLCVVSPARARACDQDPVDLFTQVDAASLVVVATVSGNSARVERTLEGDPRRRAVTLVTTRTGLGCDIVATSRPTRLLLLLARDGSGVAGYESAITPSATVLAAVAEWLAARTRDTRAAVLTRAVTTRGLHPALDVAMYLELHPEMLRAHPGIATDALRRPATDRSVAFALSRAAARAGLVDAVDPIIEWLERAEPEDLLELDGALARLTGHREPAAGRLATARRWRAWRAAHPGRLPPPRAATISEENTCPWVRTSLFDATDPDAFATEQVVIADVAGSTARARGREFHFHADAACDLGVERGGAFVLVLAPVEDGESGEPEVRIAVPLDGTAAANRTTARALAGYASTRGQEIPRLVELAADATLPARIRYHASWALELYHDLDVSLDARHRQLLLQALGTCGDDCAANLVGLAVEVRLRQARHLFEERVRAGSAYAREYKRGALRL